LYATTNSLATLYAISCLVAKIIANGLPFHLILTLAKISAPGPAVLL